MAGVNLTAVWRGRQQHCWFVHSIASLITFLPHHVYERRRCVTITVPPLICIFTPVSNIPPLFLYIFDRNTVLLKITIITILQREMYSRCPLFSSLLLAYTSTSTSIRPPFFFNHGAKALVGHGLLIVEDSWSHSIRQTMLGRTLLDEGPSQHRDLYLTKHTHTHSQETDIDAPGRIQICNSSMRIAADPRIRPCGHWYWYKTTVIL